MPSTLLTDMMKTCAILQQRFMTDKMKLVTCTFALMAPMAGICEKYPAETTAVTS